MTRQPRMYPERRSAEKADRAKRFIGPDSLKYAPRSFASASIPFPSTKAYSPRLELIYSSTSPLTFLRLLVSLENAMGS